MRKGKEKGERKKKLQSIQYEIDIWMIVEQNINRPAYTYSKAKQ